MVLMRMVNFVSVFVGVVLVWTNSANGGIIEHKKCNIYDGNWVLDNSYPLYDDSKQCLFFLNMFACGRNGRPDKDYNKYKWKPDHCVLPRFDGVKMMNELKGKRLIFVGDSISLNQWSSLTCLLHTANPNANYTSRRQGGLSIFTFPKYNVSIEMFRQAFLVDIIKEARGRVLYLDSLTSSKIWGTSDIMIFDSWHWWNNKGVKQPWEWVVYGNTTVKDLNRTVAYEMALNTWAKWIDHHVSTTKAKVFFQGVSPDHGGCVGKTRPLKEPGHLHHAQVMLEKVLRSMATPVHLLNITTLAQLRPDGHPGQYALPTKDAKDCTHWCLSGVPDIWNEFLQYDLIYEVATP